MQIFMLRCPNTLGTLTYAYDPAGRRNVVGGTYARTGTPQAVTSATYNANNQLTNWKGATLTYDLNGNLTNDGTNTYTWNARNQLVSISGGVAATFQYDAFGRRVSKTIGGTTQFLYDGANPVQELSGGTASANLLIGGVDEYFQRTDSTGASGFITDALGSTVALTDSTGTVQPTSYTFEPFGNTTVTGSATTNSFAYTGRELDSAGLYFYRARYYSPQTQRFISEDPIGLGGGINLYRFTLDSPPNRKDPFGLWAGYDDLIFSGAGAALGLTTQLISDALSGQLSSGATYAGAFTGGVAAGETFLYTDNLLLAAVVGAGVGNVTKQEIKIHVTHEQCQFNFVDLGVDTGVGILTGMVPEGTAALQGVAREFAKGLPGAVGGGISDAAKRIVLPEGEGKNMHGRKGNGGTQEEGCPANQPPPDPCAINPKACVLPLPL